MIYLFKGIWTTLFCDPILDYEKIKNDIRGPSVLAMAPFKPDYDLDTDALKEEIDFIIEGGIRRGNGHIICPCGTGEYVAMSREERRKMVETAVEAADGRIPVVAGVGTCYYKEAIQLAEDATQAGADCIMIPPPYYYALDQSEVYNWYKQIAENTENGLMIYVQPWRNIGATLGLPVIEKFAEIENIISLKYSGALPEYLTVLSQYCKRFAIIDNSRGFTSTLAHMHGAAGFITGPAAFWPDFEAEYWRLLEAGKYREADQWHAKLLPFWDFFDHGKKGKAGGEFGGGFFGASVLKAAIEYVGIRMGLVRPPFSDLAKAERQELYTILERIGVKKRT